MNVKRIPTMRTPQWVLLAAVALSTVVLAAPGSNTPWNRLTTSDASTATPRHEAASVEVGGKLYLLGGRSERPVEVFDPATQSWRVIGPAPLEINHFQPVVLGTKIYLVAAFTGGYPNETNVPDVHVFDTATETWSTDGVIPVDRRRGGAAAVIFGGKIYIVGGNNMGHNGGAVSWFDRFDPATGEWDILDDAPNARDHMQAALVGDKLIVVGGRQSTQPNPFINTVSATDIYDFTTGTWSSGLDIPTDRAGAMTIAAGSEVIVAGGEVDQVTQGLKTVEAYHVPTNTWRSLMDMNDGRHSGGGSVIGDTFHIVSGSPNRGGGQFDSHETLALNLNADLDSDGDGLSNQDEIDVYDTDVNNPDTDGDGLDDGDEVDLGTLPNVVDTDEEGLNDGEEVNTHGTNPLSSDTDSDGVDDHAELTVHQTNPLNADSDNDGLNDGAEINTHATNPLDADTDADGVDDLAELTVHLTDALNADSDSDGLNDGEEVNTHSTNPLSTDTDLDGVDDNAELTVHQTDPLNADSDNDGLNDGAEINTHGTDPLLIDTDLDTLSDAAEVNEHQTNPLSDDSDSDGLADAAELTVGTNPLDADSDDDGILDGDDDSPLPEASSGGGGISFAFVLILLVACMRQNNVKLKH